MYTCTALITKFKESDKFRSLLTLTTTRSTLVQKQYIIAVVRNFFAYVTLSHRWKSDKPALNDIAEDGVYNLPTSRFDKVRNFCLKARKCGYDWAWIDTCCIDQGSSSEVQKSISSMFSWYRRSTLTIIYLSDVVESGVQALVWSEWFLRGWTLQELLAANIIRLYKKDWTPFLQCTAFNHKDVPEILVALESATGIQQCHIKSYSPSVDHPRMKLRWAHSRVTKEKEDEAYCLMGIFGLTMTVRYGEGDRAFSRLLRKIMKHTKDATLLDWVGQPSTQNSCLPSSPRCFSDAPVGIVEMPCTVVSGFNHAVFSLAWAVTLIFVLKRAVHGSRNSSQPHNNTSTSPELSSGGSPTLTAIRSLPYDFDRTGTVSSQNGFPFKRSASFPFKGSSVRLAKLLEEPSRPYILTPEIHIIVPCFVHEVRTLYFIPRSKSYYCHADGIRSFSLVTSEQLETCVADHHSSSGYLLAQPWDPQLSESSDTHRSSLPLLRQ
ncbi:heterokaryon incompatibility protein-domain-containing protein [Suillus ampliporus]|nr:heterokaryon incompatibility protein-domain-containing protein [Suillus ampliporus]